MSVFQVQVEVGRVIDDPEFTDAGTLIVDTGSEVSWIAADTLRGAGIIVRKPDQRFRMANGDEVRRDVGYALLRVGDFETVDEVVFAASADLQLLGARTLEGFNAMVDPERRRLVPAGPIPAADASRVDRPRRKPLAP